MDQLGQLVPTFLKSLANFARAFSKVAGTLSAGFLKSQEHCQRVF
jgi:hypothetical protein